MIKIQVINLGGGTVLVSQPDGRTVTVRPGENGLADVGIDAPVSITEVATPQAPPPEA